MDGYGRLEKGEEEEYVQAKEAVTNTEANPPIPPTNGASPTYQAEAPR